MSNAKTSDPVSLFDFEFNLKLGMEKTVSICGEIV